jgi:hypothetical protein
VIRVECEQGSREWLETRIGIPTASEFSRIMTPSMKPSDSVTGYRNELLAEWLLGESLAESVSLFMQRGADEERGARSYYEMQRDVDIEEVGFLFRDDRRTGCSPDGLVGTNGGLEIKVPKAGNHVGCLLDESVPGQHRAQIQGCIWIAEREWWDFLSYNRFLPSVIVRVYRDDIFIKHLSTLVGVFCDQVAEAQEYLLKRGLRPKSPKRMDVAPLFQGVG